MFLWYGVSLSFPRVFFFLKSLILPMYEEKKVYPHFDFFPHLATFMALMVFQKHGLKCEKSYLFSETFSETSFILGTLNNATFHSVQYSHKLTKTMTKQIIIESLNRNAVTLFCNSRKVSFCSVASPATRVPFWWIHSVYYIMRSLQATSSRRIWMVTS